LLKDKLTCAMQKVTQNVISPQNRNTNPCGQYFTTTLKQWMQRYTAYPSGKLLHGRYKHLRGCRERWWKWGCHFLVSCWRVFVMNI